LRAEELPLVYIEPCRADLGELLGEYRLEGIVGHDYRCEAGVT
jgi:hypothetical protein